MYYIIISMVNNCVDKLYMRIYGKSSEYYSYKNLYESTFLDVYN